ncbi:hypothetical protein BV25DRAFT_1869834 [Artomyces pyxidatus]|uniref:Uncharacterized protein n=1 Tax=Artomyces pyxidatus TaxID=48021 RepID=A0ACB8T5T5_9AGAM|nr:hypothetical protein BV25DRAFT_1869834 [Artomyces pyxidatus]
MSSKTPYLSALLEVLPHAYASDAITLLQAPHTAQLVDTLLRLTCPSGSAPSYPSSMLSAVASSSSQKRKRTPSPAASTSKKPKPTDDDDPPLYTLHALSVTAPVRKKLDITLHTHTLRLTHPSTGAIEASFPRPALRRAFLLPTRGKSKPHWTVVLMSADTPPLPKAKNAAPTAGGAPVFQVVFGVDAVPTAAFRTTAHPAPPTEHAKASATHAPLRAFLAHLPAACALLEPATCVPAYRGAKDAGLWFLRSGVLGETPYEFFALGDLLQDEESGREAVRVVSATGRLCSVVITRKPEDEEEEGEETEFGMIDGKEMGGIKEWVRVHKAEFGKAAGGKDGAGKGKGEEEDQDGKVDSEDEDSDFEVSSDEEDGGSPSSSSDESGSGGKQSGSASANESDEEGGGGESGDEEDEDEEKLDPKHHPLMRPGAVPRMSRAAMDAAVGMVVGDMMGGADSGEDEDDDELDN